MTYEIRWTESCFRKLEKLDGRARKRITDKVEEAADNPFLAAKKLGGKDLYAIRVGDYRVIISIDSARMMVLAIDVGHRSKIYKNL